ncbi:putative epoxide hydrolase, partial [Fusarium austroafricanum]
MKFKGSFYEVSRIVNGLAEGDGKGVLSFHAVAPSLIDFGFSSASKPGFQLEHHAAAYDKLMQELGYYRYVIQAGNVRSLISRCMVKLFGPSRCLAHHTNTPLPSQPSQESHPDLYTQIQATPLTEAEQKGLAHAAVVNKEGAGYYKLQLTKPTTIGIYYFSTPGPDAPSNLYYIFEHSDPPAFNAAAAYVDVLLGISRFSNDLVLLPKLWNHTLGPIVYEADYERGGHFAAWEQPGAIVADLRLMFSASGIGAEIQRSLQ